MDHDYRFDDELTGLRIIYKTRAKTNPERHFHQSWEVLFLESGSRTFFHGSDTWQVGAGAALVVRPGLLHRALNRAGETCSLYNLYFSEPVSPWLERALPLLEACSGRVDPVITVREGDRHRIVRLFSDIAHELSRREREYESIAWGTVLILLAELSRCALPSVPFLSEGPRSRGGTRSEIADLIAWIDAHFRERIDLSVLASRVSLSPSHLSRLFHQETRYTLVEYITSVRVREACRQLLESRASASTIASQCGFGSIAQFGRAFRSLTGQSPLAYRKAVLTGRP